MTRRIHVPRLQPGDLPLDPSQAHHVRDVLRLPNGTEVDVFDNDGATTTGILLHLAKSESVVRIDSISPARAVPMLRWTIAAAVPKGERADWMVEKLSELGTSSFIPLATARSVVRPEGNAKLNRWLRIATESAKQSRRAGVMRIHPLTPLNEAIRESKTPATSGTDNAKRDISRAWFLTTEVPGMPIGDAVQSARGASFLTLFIGPEGGWTDEEIQEFQSAGFTAINLGSTILRIETAAIAAAAIVSTFPK